MRSLRSTRAPTVSAVVEPPGGVASLPGLTAVVVPICCAVLRRVRSRASMRWICILQPLQPSKSDQWSGANRQVAIRECRYVGGAVSILQQRADRQLAPDRHFETKADAPFGDVSGGERRNEWVRRAVSPGRHAGGRN